MLYACYPITTENHLRRIERQRNLCRCTDVHSRRLERLDATEPIDEVCNGLDDNCDGATDNMPADYVCYKTTNEGTCSGVGTCIGGVEICDAPDASPEV